MNRIPAVIRMHANDKLSWFYIPWIIVFSSFAVNLTVGLLINNEEPAIISGGTSSVPIYLYVAAIVSLAQTFPFAIGLSIRRTDYFWGTAAMAGIACLIHSFVLTGMGAIEQAAGSWGGTVRFFHLPFMNDGLFPEQWWVAFSVLLHGYFTGMVTASLYRRFGGYVLMGVLALLFLLTGGTVLLMVYRSSWWKPLFDTIGGYPASFYSLALALLTALFAFLSWRFLRRAV